MYLFLEQFSLYSVEVCLVAVGIWARDPLPEWKVWFHMINGKALGFGFLVCVFFRRTA